ncbi:hypothetical protein ACFL5N_00620, partial [bacterium]
YLAAHSNPELHQLNGEPFVYSHIPPTNPKVWFYNLFACKSCLYSWPNYLGGAYLCTNDYGLAVIGTTKTGSMLVAEYFYDPLGQNKTIGEAFRYWLQEVGYIQPDDAIHISWYRGMTLLGDPTLKLYPVGSPTNLITTKEKNSVTLSWTAPANPEIVGYNIYRGASDVGPFSKINTSLCAQTTFNDTPNNSNNYYYYVTALNNISIKEQQYGFSNESYPSPKVSLYFEAPKTHKISSKPNPSNPSVANPLYFFGNGIVPYDTKIIIMTISGEHVITLHEKQGSNEISWNGDNKDGNKVVSGIYIYTVKSPKQKKLGKFTLIRK